MIWRDLNNPTKGALIGGLIGLFGIIIRPMFLSMNSDPFFIFGSIGSILGLYGVGGCNWKTSINCLIADRLGYIITILVFTLTGFLLGLIVRKKK